MRQSDYAGDYIEDARCTECIERAKAQMQRARKALGLAECRDDLEGDKVEEALQLVMSHTREALHGAAWQGEGLGWQDIRRGTPRPAWTRDDRLLQTERVIGQAHRLLQNARGLRTRLDALPSLDEMDAA